MKRRRFLINSGYQLKTTAVAVTVTGIVVTAILIVIGYLAWSYSVKLERVVQNQTSFMQNQQELFTSLLYLSESRNLDSIKISREVIEGDMRNNSEMLQETVAVVSHINMVNWRFFVMLLVLLAVQTVVILLVYIRLTHRTAGPLFVLNRYITELKQGKFPEVRPLRKNDNFKDLFKNFRELVEILKKR